MLLLNPLPSPNNCPNGRRDVRKRVAGCSTNPSQAFQCVAEVEQPAMNWDRLREIYPFYTLYVKLSQALLRILPACPYLHWEVTLEENTSQTQGCMLTGKPITFRVYRHVRFSESDATLAELIELIEVEVTGGDVKRLLYDWGM